MIPSRRSSFFALIVALFAAPAFALQAPSTRPATLPAQIQVTVQTASAAPAVTDDSLIASFNRTRLGQLARGQEKVTLDEMLKIDFWTDTIKDLVLFTIGFIPRFIVAILFLAFFWIVYRAVRKLVGSSVGSGIDHSIRDMLNLIVKWGIMGFGLVIACNQIGIQITALLAGVSVIGLAVGFAAQETLANFIAGVVIFWDKPFKVGDWIEVDATFGQVQRVTFRSTRILNLDGQLIVYPNTHMLSNRLSNHTSHPLTRINVHIGIAYKESIDKARAALLAIAEQDARICKKPAPDVVVDQCADSSVNLILRLWVENESLEMAIRFEYTEKAKKALDEAGIQIPFPHMQLILESSTALEQIAAPKTKAA
jgi:small conductance mechanosensitive channel